VPGLRHFGQVHRPAGQNRSIWGPWALRSLQVLQRSGGADLTPAKGSGARITLRAGPPEPDPFRRCGSGVATRFAVAFPAEVVMLPSFSRGLRLALVLAISTGYVVWHGHSHPAYAKGGGDDDEEGDDGDDGKGGKGGEEEGDEPGEDDKDQPPVTAGGLFTLNTYPVSELLRPLTMTQNIAQLRLALGTDISDKGAFESFGLSLDAQYGMTDNFTLIGGLTDAYNFKQFSLYAGFEGALAYDLVDIRLAANLHRFAVPAKDSTNMPIPGSYAADDLKFSIDLGFPFRYAIKPEIAIIALQTLMSIDFNKSAENGAKPDLNPSIGVATNPIPELSLVAFAQLRIVDFDTTNKFTVPVTARVEFSPSQKLDIGLEFVLLNVKPPDGQSPIDNRFISLFMQSRLGK
jgi:hypothetical protein